MPRYAVSTVANRRLPFEDDKGIRVQSNWFFCFGHCERITSYLGDKNGLGWLLPKFVNAILRGVGQVVFANNPFSGLLILTGIFWHDLIIGSVVLGSTALAVVTALALKQKPEEINAGLVSFNAVLLSSVTSSLWTPLYGKLIGWNLLTFILVGSLLSVFLSNGLSNILSSFKPTIPILSIPFHILVLVTFVCLKPNMESNHDELNLNTTSPDGTIFNHSLVLGSDEAFLFGFNNSTSEQEMYSMDTLQNVLLGIVYSASQVFGIADMVTGLLIYTGVLLYSPILTFMCLHGAILATILGFYLTPFPNDEVFLGVWGFNGFLSCGAIGLFYIFNLYSVLNGTMNVIFTSAVQLCLTPHFAKSHLPVFGLPFIFSTVLFLCVSSNGHQLIRASKITFPELQRKHHMLNARRNIQQADEDRLMNV